MPAVIQATDALGRPGNDMRYAGGNLLLTARTPERFGRAGSADPADEPFPVRVGLAAFHPADGPVQIELGGLTTSAMGSGHEPIVAGTNLELQTRTLRRARGACPSRGACPTRRCESQA